jgi:hypothetical protein
MYEGDTDPVGDHVLHAERAVEIEHETTVTCNNVKPNARPRADVRAMVGEDDRESIVEDVLLRPYRVVDTTEHRQGLHGEEGQEHDLMVSPSQEA